MKSLARKLLEELNDAELVGYQWISTNGEKYSAREEGMIPTQVSDWDNSIIATQSGRKIVHVYWIKKDGEVKPYGKNIALKVLGISDDRQLENDVKPYIEKIAEDKGKVRNWLEDAQRLNNEEYFTSAPMQDNFNGKKISPSAKDVLTYYRESVAYANSHDGTDLLMSKVIFFQIGDSYTGIITHADNSENERSLKDYPKESNALSYLENHFKGFRRISFKEMKGLAEQSKSLINQ